jgi:putative hydrolase of the HAD superfamily
MGLTNIQTVIFDFGGTLDSNGIHWRNRFFELICQQIPELAWEQFEHADRKSIADFIADPATPQLNMRHSAEAILAGIDRHLEMTQLDVAQVVDLFCQNAEGYLESSRGFLERLSTTYQLGVISNNFGNTRGWCDEYDLTPFLDTIIDSTVVGIQKPDPQIFQIALTELKASPPTSIYVGDTFIDDVLGAKKAEMHSAWLVGDLDKHCPDPSLVDLELPYLQALTDFLS